MISDKDHSRYTKACIVLDSKMLIDQQTKDSLMLVKVFGKGLEQGDTFRKYSTKKVLTTIVDIVKEFGNNDLEVIEAKPTENKS